MSPRKPTGTVQLGPIDAGLVRRQFALRHASPFMHGMARETIRRARGMRDRGISR